MRLLRLVVLAVTIGSLAACGGGGTFSGNNPPPPPPAGAAPINVSLRDMPPMGVTVLSFQVTITGIVMQPGNIALISSPMTMELTQLQSMSTYLNTVSVPAGNYTSMMITLANPRMTFLNNSGGMMMGMNCPNSQICEVTPPMMASSVTINSSPFPLTVQANTPLDMLMDFDLMNSMQQNMNVNPTMSSMMRQPMSGSNAFDQMNDMMGQVSAVNASINQFTMQFVQGTPSMTVSVDNATIFEDFNTIGKPNTFAGMAAGQIVEVNMQLMGGGTLHAAKVRFENINTQELDGMVIAINNSTQFDMVVMNQAPAISGINIGDVVRMNMQAGTTFDVDDQDLPVSGMSFAGASDMMVGQVVQIEPMSALVPGTPPQMNINHVRLMMAWLTATVAAKLNSTDFTVNNLPGIFSSGGMNSLHISTSSQTEFQNVLGANTLSVGDTVSLRGPMFIASANPTMIASRVRKR